MTKNTTPANPMERLSDGWEEDEDICLSFAAR